MSAPVVLYSLAAQKLANSAFAAASADASATVETPFGMIEGNHLPVLGVNEYLSLPYAQPPTGTSRFGPPIDWSGPQFLIRANHVENGAI